jgi:hypothetical protein
LTVADKYDMPALLSKAGAFHVANAHNLSSSPKLVSLPNPHFAWKWIVLADKAGLAGAAQACFNNCFSRAGQALLEECTEEILQGMSHAMLCHMFVQQRFKSRK